MLVNDEDGVRRGSVSLVVEDKAGKVLATVSRPYQVAAYGQMTYRLSLKLPLNKGEVTLKAIATPENAGTEPTVSQRYVKLVAQGTLPAPHLPLASTMVADSGGQFDETGE